MLTLLCLILCSAITTAQDWKVPHPRWQEIWHGGVLDEENARATKTLSFANMKDTTLTIDSVFEGKIDRTQGIPQLINRRLIEVKHTFNVGGHVEKEFRTIYKADGRTPHSTTEIHRNNAGVALMEETVTYENGLPVRGNKTERNAAGGVTRRYRFNPQTRTFEPIASNTCDPKHEAFAGYSNLTKLGENESENVVMGFHLAYAYFLSQRMALAADFSMHTKKDNDLRIMQAFLMGGIQYQLIMYQHRSKMNVLARVLAGLAMDKQKYKSGSFTSTDQATAFAIAFGLGLNYELNRRIAIGLLADYIRTRFNDEGQGNLRASLGVRVNMGCK